LEVGILKGVCAFKKPQTIKVDFSGLPPAGVYPKDMILACIAKIGVAGGTGKVIEFHGEAVSAMGMDGRMTLCNMAVEAGATSGICMPDMKTVDYLWPFISADKSYTAKEQALEDFSKWTSDKDAPYCETVEIDCSKLRPLSTVGYKPDEVKPVCELAGTKIDQVYIGSCTNGRIEDLRAAAQVLKGKKIADTVRAIVSPATTGIFAQALKEGLIDIFMEAGCCVTNPTCGACLGMSNGVLAEGETCAATTNRNFYGRMGKGGTVHLVSPATAAASALAGSLTEAGL
jgi:3-isopropylmalate/(R)-2-methylmalate dehydratase large subunit